MLSPDITLVEEFYRAMEDADAHTMLRVLHPDFEARVAPGMPFGAGGVHHGPKTTLVEVWAAIYQHYEIAPYPASWHETTDGMFVVTGHYRGTARATGRDVEAEFTHLWRVEDGLLRSLHQYTDTFVWRAALSPA